MESALSDRGYQSLGGDGYISPGRRSYYPSTDLIDRPTSLRHRSQRLLFLFLTAFVVIASILATFFFFPRPISSSASSTPPSIDCFTVDPDQRNLTTFQFTHTVTVSNPNYAPLTIQSALIFFTLLPPLNTSHPHHSTTPSPSSIPLPLCYTPLPLGSIITTPSSPTLSPLSTTDVELIDRFEHEGDIVRLCLQRTCERFEAYDLTLDGLLRVKWLAVEGDVVMETVRARVKCTRDDGVE